MRSRSLVLIPCLVACVCSANAVWAQSWKSNAVAVKADPQKPTVEAVFDFTPSASGELPKFTELEEGVRLSWDDEPSQVSLGGSRKVKFNVPVGVRSGERTVVLPYTLGEQGKTDTLLVNLTIPPIADATPRRLVWRAGEAEAKDCVIKCVTPEGIIYNRASSPNEKLNVELKNEATHIYRLTVTPSGPLQRGRSVVVIEGEDASGARTSFNVYLEIR
jgi:hypothetical protein